MSVYDDLVTRGLSSRSIEIYLGEFRRFETWCAAHEFDPATISAGAVRAYAESRPRSWSTQKAIRSTLKHYWSITGRPDGPYHAVWVPPKPRMVCRALDVDQAATVARAASDRRDRKAFAVLLAMYVGLRRAEIATLRWDHFQDEDTWLTVTGKGGVVATLPVHPRLLEALRALPRTGEWVFTGSRGRAHVTPATVWDWIRDLGAELGFDLAPHRLRHTCLATANDATGDLRAVQEFARHAKPETTAGYTRATAKRLQQVMLSIDYLDDVA